VVRVGETSLQRLALRGRCDAPLGALRLDGFAGSSRTLGGSTLSNRTWIPRCLASRVVGTFPLPPSPWPLPAWRSRASRGRAACILRCGPAPSVAFAPVQSCCFRPGRSVGPRIGVTRRSRRPRRFLPLVGFVRWGRSASLRLATPRPSIGHAPESTPTGVAACFGAEGTTLAARSVLVVSHDLDGFLLRFARGLVASRCRSWGSPRFQRDRLAPPDPERSDETEPIVTFPATYVRTPRRMFPSGSRTASPRPLPPCRFDGFEALLHLRVRYACRGLLPDLRPVLPGLRSPSKVLPDGSGLAATVRGSSAPRPVRGAAHHRGGVRVAFGGSHR
jgi:hypothetical protein